MGPGRAEFLSRVAERANVPEEQASGLVDDFLTALAKTVDRGTWEKIQEIVPMAVDAQQGEVGEKPLTIEQFLLELSGREPVADERAATHARAVAGAIREEASESQFEQLRSRMEDDTLLALFEEERGELTAVADPTDGEIAQHTPPVADREESPPLQESDEDR